MIRFDAEGDLCLLDACFRRGEDGALVLALSLVGIALLAAAGLAGYRASSLEPGSTPRFAVAVILGWLGAASTTAGVLLGVG